jgi:hypothetical protein
MFGTAASLPSHVPGIPSQSMSVRVDPHLDAEAAMTDTRQGVHPGYVDMRPVRPSSFRPVVDVPSSPYVLDGIDLGGDLLDVAPREALVRILDAGRSPLTLEEGVSVLLAHPGILRERNCYQMLGSRAGDKRIPSLWVTKAGRPRLGWCWEGTPHTWLGAASCAARIA